MRRRGIACIGTITLALALLVGTAGAAHWESHIGPQEPERDFPEDFDPPDDAQADSTLGTWDEADVGGWGGGGCPAGAERTPVVFVHGNSEDAWFWRASPSGDGTIVGVREAFLDAGYCPEELWAISYTGAAGYTTSNDVNTADVLGFVEAVLEDTGVSTVDVVAHSLGVTVVRKAGLDDPGLYGKIRRFTAIAGPNHGAATCRGARTATGSAGVEHPSVHVSHACEEIEPGSPWLAQLNAVGETPPGPEYLTIYEGTGTVDTFYLGPIDAKSPRLESACNHEMPFTAHNTLARGRDAVDTYLEFLVEGTLPACVENE